MAANNLKEWVEANAPEPIRAAVSFCTYCRGGETPMDPKNYRMKQDRALERDRHMSEIAQCAGCGAQLRLDLDKVWKGRCVCPVPGEKEEATDGR